MNCPNCGTTNNHDFKFCIKCGETLERANTPLNQSIVNEKVLTDQPVQVQQSLQSTPTVNIYQHSTTNIDSATINFTKYIISFLLKPFETYKQNESKLENVKNGLILSGIVAGILMIVNFLTAMMSSIFVKTMDYSTFKYKTEFDLSGLKNLDYLSLIVKNLLIYFCIILAIAVVYYLGTLVVKKSINFIKILSISASSIIPYVIIGNIVSLILGKIWNPLLIVATVIGIVYSVIIFVLLISDNINFEEKDMTVYFHLVCMSILGTAGYYTYIKIFTSGITNQISDYLEMFK